MAGVPAQNLASRSRIRPAKTRFPETSARGASTPAGPSDPRLGGGLSFLGASYTGTMNIAQLSRVFVFSCFWPIELPVSAWGLPWLAKPAPRADR